MPYLYTSESVSEGHPDKVADQISDAILDAYLKGDPDSRVAVETMVTKNRVVIAGETRSELAVDVDVEKIARDVIRDIGYTDPELRFDAENCKIEHHIQKQSSDIARGVDRTDKKEQGAGDQGMMFGYACQEVDRDGVDRVLMPMPLVYAHKLMRELAHIRKRTDLMPYLRPDAKSQVTIEYKDDRRTPRRVHTVVVSTQHCRCVSVEEIKADVEKHLLPKVIPEHLQVDRLKLIVNPAGPFVRGGPFADTGLTGRKIIVDTYGGRGAHGGGAFSGKDPSKVDRSGAYAARHVAKNLVAAGLADLVEIQIAYAIGKPKPVSIHVDSSGSSHHGLSDEDLSDIVNDVFDLSPAAIINRLCLKRPIYRKTAVYGHFGRSEFSWEDLGAVEKLQRHALTFRSRAPMLVS